MTYFQFIHAVETKVKKEVEEEKTVSIHTNVKNNGVRRSGIMISEKESIFHRRFIWKSIFISSGWGIRWNRLQKICRII